MVHPAREIKFLGLHISSDLTWIKQVNELCSAIRHAAGRIRLEGRDLCVQERRILYHGWVGGRLCSNAGAFLKSLSNKDINRIQTACNAALRAVLGLPKRGKNDLDIGRQRLGIPTVRQVMEQRECLLAWEQRSYFRERAARGRCTRRREAGDLAVPDQRGQRRFLSRTRAELKWNELPDCIRQADDKQSAKKLIRSHVMTTVL